MTEMSTSRNFKNCKFSARSLQKHSRGKIHEPVTLHSTSQQTEAARDKTNLFLTASFWPKFEQSSDYLY